MYYLDSAKAAKSTSQIRGAQSGTSDAVCPFHNRQVRSRSALPPDRLRWLRDAVSSPYDAQVSIEEQVDETVHGLAHAGTERHQGVQLPVLGPIYQNSRDNSEENPLGDEEYGNDEELSRQADFLPLAALSV